MRGFNTQPPEGGWRQEAELAAKEEVSTHSRLKAAGAQIYNAYPYHFVSTHSRLKAAGN